MARRYSGDVTVDLLWDDRGYYKGRVSWPGGSFDATGLRLSPHDSRRLAADSPEAYDAASEAALGFASNDHEEVYAHGEQYPASPNFDKWLVRRARPSRRNGAEEDAFAADMRRRFPATAARGKRPCLACGKLFVPEDDQQTACSRACVRAYVLGRRAKGRIEVERRPNPTHRFGHDAFARTETRRETAGSGKCDWCGQDRPTLYRYGTASDGGRFLGFAKGRFCNVQDFRAYHGQ